MGLNLWQPHGLRCAFFSNLYPRDFFKIKTVGVNLPGLNVWIKNSVLYR